MKPFSMPRWVACLTLAVGGPALVVLAACNALEQTAPSQFSDANLNNPASAPLLANSAIADFECALAEYVVATGLVSDELLDAQLSAAGWDYDRRTITPASVPYGSTTCDQGVQVVGLFTPLSTARFSGDDAARRLQGWTDAQVPGRQDLIAIAETHAAFAIVLLGESMCTATVNGGPEMTPQQLFTDAVSRFGDAITAATTAGDSSILLTALDGRARAELDLQDYTAARADAELVPAAFVRTATYSSSKPRRENRVFTQMWRDNFSSVEGAFRNATFDGVPDPRVSVVNSGQVGQDATTIVWRANKYPAINSPIPIASGREMQLVIAEADVNGAGDPNEAVTIINGFHASAGLPPYDPNAAGAKSVHDQLIEERSRELFLEGHRLWDLIRFQLPLVPAAGTPYPPKAGGIYGSQLCFPLPDVERNNNPNLNGH